VIGGETRMMYWGWNGGPGGWVAGLVGMLIWLVIIGLFVLVVVRLFSGPRHDRYWSPQPRPDDPEEILRARFARGEIAPDEFEQRLEVLRRTRPPSPPPK
jgi:putative membrane protein